MILRQNVLYLHVDGAGIIQLVK